MGVSRPDPAAVVALWSAYCRSAGVHGEPADVFSFGDSAELADALADLVLQGTKRATAGSVREYAEAGWTPHVGALSVVCRGGGAPVAVIRSTQVRTGPLSSVDEAFAWDEGEGDRTRDGWLEAHRVYFARVFAARGWEADDDPDVVFERFAVVWPGPASETA